MRCALQNYPAGMKDLLYPWTANERKRRKPLWKGLVTREAHTKINPRHRSVAIFVFRPGACHRLIILTSAPLMILRVGVIGMASMGTSRSGHLNLATP